MGPRGTSRRGHRPRRFARRRPRPAAGVRRLRPELAVRGPLHRPGRGAGGRSAERRHPGGRRSRGARRLGRRSHGPRGRRRRWPLLSRRCSPTSSCTSRWRRPPRPGRGLRRPRAVRKIENIYDKVLWMTVSVGLEVRPLADSDEGAVLRLLPASLAGGPTGERTATSSAGSTSRTRSARASRWARSTAAGWSACGRSCAGRSAGGRRSRQAGWSTPPPTRLPGPRHLPAAHHRRSGWPRRHRAGLQHAQREQPPRLPEDGLERRVGDGHLVRPGASAAIRARHPVGDVPAGTDGVRAASTLPQVGEVLRRTKATCETCWPPVGQRVGRGWSPTPTWSTSGGGTPGPRASTTARFRSCVTAGSAPWASAGCVHGAGCAS